jgi:hypothetical protein
MKTENFLPIAFLDETSDCSRSPWSDLNSRHPTPRKSVLSADRSSSSSASSPVSSVRRSPYWEARYVVLNAGLVVVALIAAYLEYSVYPLIMSQSFGESPSLQLSLLTFQWNATRSGLLIPGVASLDFFQIFAISLIGINIWHFVKRPR